MTSQIKGVWVKILEPGLIEVESFSQKGKWYVVDKKEKTGICPDFRYRGRTCKRIRLVEENEGLINLEEKVWRANREFEEWREKQAPALAALKLMHILKSN